MKKVNGSRIECFRQLKTAIRGSKVHLIVGIDIAKEKNYAFFGNAKGNTFLKRLIFENNLEGFEKLLTYSESIRLKNKLEKVVFGLEPTACYHKPLGEYLIKRSHMLVLVSATAVKRNRELLDGRWDKNDTKDAANIADLISQGKCLYYDFPSEIIRSIQSLLSYKKKLKKMEHSVRMRIRNHLISQYFPEMDKYFGPGKEECLSIIKKIFNPVKISEMEYEEFHRIVGEFKESISLQKRLIGVNKVAGESIGCEMLDAIEFEAGLLIDILRQIRRDQIKVEEKIKENCGKCPEYECIQSIPGIGPVISSIILGSIGDPYRFTNGKQVLKLAGLDLSANRSGKYSEGVTPRISKKGKSELRYGLFQAAKVASTKNIDFINYFSDKLQGREKEKGIKTKMRVKLSSKMLIMSWTLMKNKTTYNAKYIKETFKETIPTTNNKETK